MTSPPVIIKAVWCM